MGSKTMNSEPLMLRKLTWNGWTAGLGPFVDVSYGSPPPGPPPPTPPLKKLVIGLGFSAFTAAFPFPFLLLFSPEA